MQGWCGPHTKRNVWKVERLQRMAMMTVPELRGMTYEERLWGLDISTPEQRRERGEPNTSLQTNE